MSELIAALPMYDFEEVRSATDALWSAIAGRLREAGLGNVPTSLVRDVAPPAVWRSPDLLLAQTCGYPLMNGIAGDAIPLARPVYQAPGCEDAGRHCSFLVVRADANGHVLADFRGRVAALNGHDSNTGMNLFRHAVAPHARDGRFFGGLVMTGAHVESLAAVATGRADIAAVDCVSFALLARYRPRAVVGIRVLGRTASGPTLPIITARQRSPAERRTIRRILGSIGVDPALAPVRAALLLEGFVPCDKRTYRRIDGLARQAAAGGYPRLA
ncbi:phosphate/phosphite/phosphonate ABC transporter substrate-binding protein [Oceanibacterium hippocampi]|uniref:ABC transporter, phosphonate, periplasmic substrate-binding protein n=1 Tax=Oceanibacterium hippocampi TaxID=745714 RepID=A0A1Y5RFP9_9PROT|nr:PhnD/SsuA/transferrin family substrate-binding protein [Oceanibacterium hippocampi]SLN15152.1 ABC transporter, phosphonate, periplasmic substrate-binding protein [Oceanibacterium hippocampi]